MGRQQSRIGIDGRHRFLSSCGGRASLRPVAQLLSIGGRRCMSAPGVSGPMLVEAVEPVVVLVRCETTAVFVVVSGRELNETLLCEAVARSGSRVDEPKGRVVPAEFTGVQLHDCDRSPIVVW